MSSNAARAPGDAVTASPPEETRRSMLARAALLAGGVGIGALVTADQAAAARFEETLDVVPPAGQQAVRLLPSGAVAFSASVGGALNLDNTASTGAGAVLYSNRGADALGRLLVVNQGNAANPQHAVRIQNAGTAHTVSIYHDPAAGAGDDTAEAVDIVSTNPLDTALGVEGREEGRGTVKITHAKPANPDPGASALSIALEGADTACQGIFIGNDAGNVTTGNLLSIRNGGPGSDRLVLTAAGRMELAVQGPEGGLVIGGDANLYRSSADVLATNGAIDASALRLASAGRSVAGSLYDVAQVPASSTIALGPGAGLRGVAVSAAIATDGALHPSSLVMFNFNSAITPSAPTDLKAVEIFKSSPAVNGLPGAVSGVKASILSSFQHQLRLEPIAGGGTGSMTAVYGFYAPPITNRVGTGWAVSTYSLLRLEAPGGTGTIAHLTGLDIRDFNARGTNNYSLRSFGNAVHMRHSGGVNLGSQATPDTLLHLRANPSFHGSLTLDAQASDPPAPTAPGKARIYVKQSKLVVQWNDGAQTLYTTIPLDAAGPYPAIVPVTTDTAAP